MDVSRRDVVVAGALALGASGFLLSGSADAQGGDEAAVAQSVETLRKGQLEADLSGRHLLQFGELDGKATTTKIGALQVWQKQDGGWKLLARQGFRLPA